MAVNYAAQPSLAPAKHYNPYGYPTGDETSSSDSSQTASPNSFSPSPQPSHIHNPLRQLRPPKKPLYTPAVLRRTQHRTAVPRQDETGMITPPSSAETSPANGTPAEEDEDKALRTFLGAGVVSGGVSRIVTDEWSEKRTEPVTGTPTKDHWKPDDAVSACDMTQCNLAFGLLRRRHHCRRCGNIFCADHARFQVPLDQHARFHPKGFQERACEACAKDFRFWQKAMMMKRRHSLSETSASRSSNPAGSVGVPGAGDKALQDPGSGKGTEARKDNTATSYVGSLGNIGNWSTF